MNTYPLLGLTILTGEMLLQDVVLNKQALTRRPLHKDRAAHHSVSGAHITWDKVQQFPCISSSSLNNETHEYAGLFDSMASIICGYVKKHIMK
jgi:hypothetical protein